MIRPLTTLSLLLTLMVCFAGCGDSGSSSSSTTSTSDAGSADAAKKLTIAVIPKGTTHEFWKSIEAGAKKAGSELDVEIIWKGPLREDDREDQIKVVEDFITRKVDGIVLAPLDDKALRAPVRTAVNTGIPVVIIDSGLDSKDHASFVATDNYQGGVMAGEHLAKLLGGKGKVVMLRYQEGSASTANREKGFLEAISETEGITIVSSNQYGGATTESAYQASENLLTPYKSADGSLSIDGIYCPNESTTFGMLRALEDIGAAGKVKFVGFDASTKLVQGLDAGKINALVVQNPFKMGYEGVKTLVAHINDETVKQRVDTGVVLATKANRNDDGVKPVLEPSFD